MTGMRGLVRGDMPLGSPSLLGVWGAGGLGAERSQLLSQTLVGKHGDQSSPVVPEVKMYRHVSIMLWGADKYPGTGASPSAEASASKSRIPAEWAPGPAAHRWSPIARRAGRSGSSDARNSGCGRKARLRGSTLRHPEAFPTP